MGGSVVRLSAALGAFVARTKRRREILGSSAVHLGERVGFDSATCSGSTPGDPSHGSLLTRRAVASSLSEVLQRRGLVGVGSWSCPTAAKPLTAREETTLFS